MKILIIHTNYQFKGGEDFVAKQETELLSQRYTVDSLFFQNKSGLKGALQFLLSICNLYSTRRVKLKIKNFQPDLVHIHNWHYGCGPQIFRAIKKKKLPIVHTLHNYRLICPSAILLYKNKLFLNSLNEDFSWSAVKNKVYRNSYLQTFWLAIIVWIHGKFGTWSKIDQFICLTQFSKNLFLHSKLNLSENKLTVKPNFLEITKSESMLNRDEHFVFIGRLSEEKGVLCLLEVFKNVPYRLKIAGDGPLKSEIIRVTEKHNNILYLGLLEKENVLDEIIQAQALIFPSLWYEGMPMTIIESLAGSTPVIASNLGAMSSMIIDGENGLHFEAGNQESLRKTILKFMKLTKREKEQMQQNAFKCYERLYSPDKQMAFFDEIYKKAILSNKKTYCNQD